MYFADAAAAALCVGEHLIHRQCRAFDGDVPESIDQYRHTVLINFAKDS